MSFVKKLANQRDIVIQLIRSTNSQGEDLYAYIMLKADQWERLKRKQQHQTIDLSKEAYVIHSGLGHTPDPALQYAMSLLTRQLQQ